MHLHSLISHAVATGLRASAVSLIILACSVTSWAAQDSPRPLQVFILAGQSNMVGAAKIATIDYIAEDPGTLPMHAKMRAGDGKLRMVQDTWISYYQANAANDPNGEGFGQLTAGYGGRKDPTQAGDNIGPELTFGIYMQEGLKQPILIIKTAWGGKSLHTDFRPPSAGPYELNESQIQAIQKNGRDLDEEINSKKAASGVYYRLMLGHVQHVLADIGRVYPDYDEQQGYELAGFVWFQGWNDLVDRGVYPQRDKQGGYDKYSECMAQFIRDVRSDLKVPKLPFVIGVMGVDGPLENIADRYRGIHSNFREAMAAPAGLPEFSGNVMAVRTAPYWDMPIARIIKKRDAFNQRKRGVEKDVKDGKLAPEQAAEKMKTLAAEALSAEEVELLKRGASNAAYHYLGCGKTMALIGKAFAEAILELHRR